MTTIQDSFNNLPDVNSGNHFGTIMGYGTSGHPIALTLLAQLSQDITATVEPFGNAGDLSVFDQRYRVFRPWIQEAIYRAIRSGNGQYLVLDFGDDIADWGAAPIDRVPGPYQLYDRLPTVQLIRDGYTLVDAEPIDPARYLFIDNPYPFILGKVLDAELATHDRISTGIADQVTSPGILLFGINNLYRTLMAGGQALANLTTRLLQAKRATVNGGTLAYSREEERVDLVPKQYSREHESLRMIENRVCAISGMPSFIIWGHTDGDGFGVKTSLQLYSQRLGSMAQRYLIPALDQLAQLLLPGDTDVPRFRIADLYPEDKADRTSRFEGTVSGLIALVSVGAITAIEARDTVASDFDLVLTANPTVITGADQPA